MRLLFLSFVCAVGGFGTAVPLLAAERAKRNVVLLIADDLGFQLGCYGNTIIRTPNIDGLAKKGVRFTSAFAAVSSCSPSRATLYTGMHTHTNGQYGLAHAEHNFHTFANVPSLPGLLKANGYRTGILGKIHVQPRSVYPFDVELVHGLAGNRSPAYAGRSPENAYFGRHTQCLRGS